MISEADDQLQHAAASEVGVIFGRREAGDDRMSRLYTIRGLGYKGMGQIQLAKDDLNKAIGFSQSNLWAQMEKQ